MTITPINIRRVEKCDFPTIEIQWSDNTSHTHTVAALRTACPCASCREKKKAQAEKTNILPVLKIEETLPVDIKSMQAVGNYGYNIEFTDGHDSGIFTFEFLHGLG